MAKKFNKNTFEYRETWNTRFGPSKRVVFREQGRFVDNVSIRQIKTGEVVFSL